MSSFFQPGANLAGATGTPTRPENVEVPFISNRIPSTMDWNHPIGKEWIYPGNSIWKLLNVVGSRGVNTATWVQITDADGSISSVLGTANQITASTAAGVSTLSIPSTFTAPGSITATGDITTTAGNVVISGAAKQLQIEGGAVTDFIGSATLVAGTVTIANTNIAAGDRIFIQRISALGAALGELTYTISAATSFTITSVIQGTPTDPETQDLSTVAYFIVRQL